MMTNIYIYIYTFIILLLLLLLLLLLSLSSRLRAEAVVAPGRRRVRPAVRLDALRCPLGEATHLRGGGGYC